ncbi:hypothetical protein ACUNDX_06595 [Serratia sp. IR-2025]
MNELAIAISALAVAISSVSSAGITLPKWRRDMPHKPLPVEILAVIENGDRLDAYLKN